MKHIPVLLQEVVDGLQLQPNTHCLDATVGGGGHARALLEQIAPRGRLIGMDRDRTALLVAAEELEEFGDRFLSIHDSYAYILNHRSQIQDLLPLSGILLDLGLSSIQVDSPERGFSFRYDGPLDMRFQPDAGGATAADLLNSQSEEELRAVFKEYGEEPNAGRIARAIVARRDKQPFQKTNDLVELIQSLSRARSRIHPATRVFQALRIAVNHELEHLEQFLPTAVELLASGGRLAIISFHSLEDRMVKQFFKKCSLDCVCPKELPECRCDHRATLKRVTKKPIIASEEEIQQNPRSRSAKLRIAEKF